MTLDSGAFGFNFHLRCDSPGASGLQTTLPFDFDQTNAASSGRFQSRIVTQRGDFDSSSLGDFVDRLAGVGRNSSAVDLDLKRLNADGIVHRNSQLQEEDNDAANVAAEKGAEHSLSSLENQRENVALDFISPTRVCPVFYSTI